MRQRSSSLNDLMEHINDRLHIQKKPKQMHIKGFESVKFKDISPFKTSKYLLFMSHQLSTFS